MFGDGAAGRVTLEGETEIDITPGAGVTLSWTVCRPPHFFGPEAGDGSGDSLPDQINDAEKTLQFSDDKLSGALTVLTSVAPDTNPGSLFSKGAAAFKAAVDALPGTKKLKDALLTGPAMAESFPNRVDICHDSNLPREFRAALKARIFNLMYELQTIQRPSASLLIGARAR